MPSTTIDVGEAPGCSAAADLRSRIEDDLEQLDRDLADWWSPSCARPRLTLLDDRLRAHGDKAAVARSGLRRRYEETLAYLATRPHGATADEAATALQPARGGGTDPVSARAYVHRVTAAPAPGWLPTRPPSALSSSHSGRYTLTTCSSTSTCSASCARRAGTTACPTCWPLFIWCPGRHSPSVRPVTSGWMAWTSP